MKAISLFYKEGASDKIYDVQLQEQGSGFVVNFQYGRRGNAFQSGTKTPKPVSEEEAEKIYNKLVKEKMGKGYQESENAKGGFSGPVPDKKETFGIFPQLLNSIEESEVQAFINDDNYLAQQKFDGQRRMIKSDGKLGDGLFGLNKKGQEVQLPDGIRDSIINVRCIVDGEIIGEKQYLFDTLSIRGVDLTNMSCIERLKQLESLKFGKNIEVVKTAYSRAEKQKMYDDLKKNNAEGIVFKRKYSVYVPGRPASGGNHLKFKFTKEASFIVKDITKGKRSIGLELLNENGERVHMGKCTVPPNKEIPAIGSVVEVRYLYAYRGGAVFQPNYKEQRNDVDVEECLMTQIVYKSGQEDEEEA